MRRSLTHLLFPFLCCATLILADDGAHLEAVAAISAIKLVELILLTVLGILAVSALGAVVWYLRGDPPGIRSHWGGFGNRGRGWNINASLTYLIIAVILATLFAAVGAYGLNALSAVGIVTSKVDEDKLSGRKDDKKSKIVVTCPMNASCPPDVTTEISKPAPKPGQVKGK